MSSTAKSLSGTNWAETLAQAEQALGAALETVRQRQKALDDYFRAAQPGDSPTSNWPQALEESYRRIHELMAMSEKAGAGVAEVDATLAEGEAALQDWLAATGAARGKLANWLTGAVK